MTEKSSNEGKEKQSSEINQYLNKLIWVNNEYDFLEKKKEVNVDQENYISKLDYFLENKDNEITYFAKLLDYNQNSKSFNIQKISNTNSNQLTENSNKIFYSADQIKSKIVSNIENLSKYEKLEFDNSSKDILIPEKLVYNILQRSKKNEIITILNSENIIFYDSKIAKNDYNFINEDFMNNIKNNNISYILFPHSSNNNKNKKYRKESFITNLFKGKIANKNLLNQMLEALKLFDLFINNFNSFVSNNLIDFLVDINAKQIISMKLISYPFPIFDKNNLSTIFHILINEISNKKEEYNITSDFSYDYFKISKYPVNNSDKILSLNKIYGQLGTLNFTKDEILNFFKIFLAMLYLSINNLKEFYRLLNIKDYPINNTNILDFKKNILNYLYHKTLEYLCKKINNFFNNNNTNGKILKNIYVYECLGYSNSMIENNLNDLLINYSYEKIFNIFSKKAFLDVIYEYQRENIFFDTFELNYIDNSELLSFFESENNVFDIIINNYDNINKLIKNIKEKFIDDSEYISFLYLDNNINSILIHHSFGDIYYNISGILANNKPLDENFIRLLNQKSQNLIIKKIVIDNPTLIETNLKKMKEIFHLLESTSSKFYHIIYLSEDLNENNSNYIYSQIITSNLCDVFNFDMLKYECKISHKDFVSYLYQLNDLSRNIINKNKENMILKKNKSDMQLIKEIMSKMEYCELKNIFEPTHQNIQIGVSFIYYNKNVYAKLLKCLFLSKTAIKIQEKYKIYISKKKGIIKITEQKKEMFFDSGIKKGENTLYLENIELKKLNNKLLKENSELKSILNNNIENDQKNSDTTHYLSKLLEKKNNLLLNSKNINKSVINEENASDMLDKDSDKKFYSDLEEKIQIKDDILNCLNTVNILSFELIKIKNSQVTLMKLIQKNNNKNNFLQINQKLFFLEKKEQNIIKKINEIMGKYELFDVNEIKNKLDTDAIPKNNNENFVFNYEYNYENDNKEEY